MRRRIIIIAGNHACNNPRALKEADALAAAGYDVEWLGAWVNRDLADRDRELLFARPWKFTPVVDWTPSGIDGVLRKHLQRARRWLGLKQFHLLGLENHLQLGYCSRELLLEAFQRQADLYIAHSETALWATYRLSKMGRT